MAAKAHAMLEGQVHVGTENVAAMAAPVLRHRIIPNFSATSEGLTSDDIIERIVEEVPPKEKLNSWGEPGNLPVTRDGRATS